MSENQEGGTTVVREEHQQQTTQTFGPGGTQIYRESSSSVTKTGYVDELGMRLTATQLAAQKEGVPVEEYTRLRANRQRQLANKVHNQYVEALISQGVENAKEAKCLFIFLDGYDVINGATAVRSAFEVSNESGVVQRGAQASDPYFQVPGQRGSGEKRGSKEGATGMGDRSQYVNQNFNPPQNQSARQSLSRRGAVGTTSQRGQLQRGGSSENVNTARAHSAERTGSREKTGSGEKAQGPGQDRSLYVNQNFNPPQNQSARQQLSSRGAVTASQRGQLQKSGSSENVVTARALSSERTGSREKTGSGEKAKGPGQDRSLYVNQDFNPAPQNP